MEARHVWVLNLDADLELEAPGEYRTPRALLPRMREERQRVRHLLGREDLLLEAGQPPPPGAAGCAGRAWCPTPSAVALLEAAGAIPPAAPPLAVLQEVNHRAFASSLGEGLPGAGFARTEEHVRLLLAAASPGSPWLLKRAFGFSGRGHRRVSAGRLRAADEAWVRASVGRGGLQVEPRVAIECELLVHGWVEPGGALRLGPAVVQQTDDRGAWLGARPATGELSTQVEAAFLAEAARVGRALHRAGYFGPFGLDGFLWRSPEGLRLQALSDLNARYTMAWGRFGLAPWEGGSRRSG